MTAQERRSMRALAALLLLSSLVRVGWEHRGASARVAVGSQSVLPELLAASESLSVEQELRDRRLLEGETLDINAASEVEWDRLPGVGAVTARRIVETRDRLGGFGTPRGLLDVPGIGEKTFADLEPYLAMRTPASGARGRSSPTTDVRIDINRAGAEELESLPGIGPALALRIIEYREAEGDFGSVDALLSVRGIGPTILGRFSDQVRVREPP